MPGNPLRKLARGPMRIARLSYMRLRRLLPDADPIRYGGFPGPRYRKVGDRLMTRLVPDWERDDIPGYEIALLEGLRQTVQRGDRIVVIGGGMGITAVAAAVMAGPSGKVICYEGNLDSVRRIGITAQNNDVVERLEIRAAIVGEDIGVYKGSHSTTVVSAGELPECDILQLDCEGAERVILGAMSIRPRAVVVETHGFLGAPTAEIRHRLEETGYAVTDLGIAEPRFGDMCVIRDVHVLLGVRD